MSKIYLAHLQQEQQQQQWVQGVLVVAIVLMPCAWFAAVRFGRSSVRLGSLCCALLLRSCKRKNMRTAIKT